MPVSEQGGRRALTKAQNRQAILAAARQVFARMGYGAATVRDIIRATPLASGTFYNYFKSKEEVYQALRDEVALAIRPRLHAERAQSATAEEFVVRSFTAFFEFVAVNRENFQPSEPARLGMETPEMAASFEDLHADLQLAIERGLFADIDSEYLAASFAGVAAEIAGRMLQRDACDAAGAAEFAAALFLGGIKSLPRPR